jgi:hypothetical protein
MPAHVDVEIAVPSRYHSTGLQSPEDGLDANRSQTKIGAKEKLAIATIDAPSRLGVLVAIVIIRPHILGIDQASDRFTAAVAKFDRPCPACRHKLEQIDRLDRFSHSAKP